MRQIAMLVLVTAVLVMQACATGPRYDTQVYSDKIRPTDVTTDADQYSGVSVLWGGIIVNSANTQGGTQVEVLAYPLTSAQEPDTDQSPDGRFLVIEERYLESLDYAPGRLLTIAGSLTGTRSGQIGDATYVYPVIRPDQMHLWPRAGDRPETQFHIGVGAVFGH